MFRELFSFSVYFALPRCDLASKWSRRLTTQNQVH